MNVLALGCLTEATGNAVTTRRVATHLRHQHRVTLVDTCSLPDLGALSALVRREQIDVAVGVHALFAGPFLARLGLPYGLVFGGTDLYEPAHELSRRQMTLGVRGASACVAFSHQNLARARALWPELGDRGCVIPQAVEPTPLEAFSLRRLLNLRSDAIVLLLPAGLRRVKAPCFLFDAVAQWHREDPRVHLVVVGDALEPDYAQGVLARIVEQPSICHLAPLPRPQLLSAMREADLVVNSSVSEGMCGVLLEAMQVGTPVLARRNAGNESLVEPGRTGMLFDSGPRFVTQARAVLGSPRLRATLVRAASAKVARDHAPERERDDYLNWLDQLLTREVRAAC